MTSRQNASPPSATDAAGRWLSIVEDGFLEGAGEAVKQGVADALMPLLSAALAGPAGAAVAGVLKALFTRVDQRSAEIARALNVALDEPFRTSARTLEEVAAVSLSTQAEVDEARRQLRNAYDGFAKAYTYALSEHPERCSLIRIYQALAAALVPGLHPFAWEIVRRLREETAGRREAALADIESLSRDIEKYAMLADHAEMRIPTHENDRTGARLAAHYSNLSAQCRERVKTRSVEISECETVLRACGFVEGLLTAESG